MTPEEELQRAGRAEQILGDDLFKEAVKEVEDALLNGIKLSPIKDAEMREKLCQQRGVPLSRVRTTRPAHRRRHLRSL